MPEHHETEITNTLAHPVPVQAVDQLTRTYTQVGPNGFFIVLAGLVILFVMGVFWYSLKVGQEVAQKNQERLYEQLKDEQRTSASREEKLIDRADKLARDQFDRWEKSREKSEMLAAKIESIGTKVDVGLLEIKALALAVKTAPEKK